MNKTGNIYLIESTSRQELADTFMRFQEYYESPVFKGRYFSRDEFASWYVGQYGSFSYARDWAGFNIPSRVLEPFKNGEFGELTLKEQKLLNILGNIGDNSYIIGATLQDEWFRDTVKHEFVHGAFFTDQNYRNSIVKFVAEQRTEKIKKALLGMGYGGDVLDDEANAYLLTEHQTLAEDVSLGEGKKLRDMLDGIFAKYFGFSVVRTSAEALMRRIKKFSL